MVENEDIQIQGTNPTEIEDEMDDVEEEADLAGVVQKTEEIDLQPIQSIKGYDFGSSELPKPLSQQFAGQKRKKSSRKQRKKESENQRKVSRIQDEVRNRTQDVDFLSTNKKRNKKGKTKLELQNSMSMKDWENKLETSTVDFKSANKRQKKQKVKRSGKANKSNRFTILGE